MRGDALGDKVIRGYRCAYHDPHGNLGVFYDPHGCRGHGPTWDCTIVALVDSDERMTYVRGVGWRPESEAYPPPSSGLAS